MLQWIFNKLSGDYNQKHIGKILPLVREVNDMCESFNDWTNEQLKDHTTVLKKKYADGKTLDELLPEAYGLVKQACKRLVGQTVEVKGEKLVWNMVPYDVQIIGGIVLHRKTIAEMKTGEGKTLVAAFPAYLNALTGEGVHVVTVNDYLASRDAEWIGHLHAFLGLEVGSVTKSTPVHLRRREYEKDITYVENSELGFDYLRDNLAKSLEARQLIRRPLAFAIVDEIDSILIDEARTPLIISEPHAEATDKYGYYAKIIQSLTPCSSKKKVSKGLLHELVNDEKVMEEDGDYYLDEKNKTALLSGKGIEKLERLLGVENLYKDIGYEEIHHIENALKAKACFEIDKDYIVREGEVLIVDQHTGRALPGRRFSEGLHQAIEAKENVSVQRESRTLATITYQNFFKQYKKLAGMTGTATTEGEEFHKIYELEVLAIPTHHELIRVDANDKVFYNQQSKRKAVQEYISFAHEMGQPILIGTSSIYTSEHVSGMLTKKNIIHNVLNAKHHEKEAHIVSHAGEYKSVIVATNMAGRGTDIKLQPGLYEKLADNYARWMKKGTSVIIYSSREFEYTMEGVKRIRGATDEQIRQAEKGWTTCGDVEFKIQFSKKKKNPTDVFVQIVTRPTGVVESTLVEKELHYGLFIMGTEKHDSRRIDNQLRGRAGRQGDPGYSVFFVALDDLIMRQMGGEKIQSIASFMFSKKDLEELELSQKQFSSSIVRAQKNMEGRHFSIRKHLFDYDSVIDKQRQRVYTRRDEILFSGKSPESQEAFVTQTMTDIVSYVHDIVEKQLADARTLQQPIADFLDTLGQELGVEIPTSKKQELEKIGYAQLLEPLKQFFADHIASTLGVVSAQGRYQIFTQIFLQTLDTLWVTHIDEMQYLRDKVGLMGYAQMDPLVMYKKEAFEKFQQLMYRFKYDTIAALMRLKFTAQEPTPTIINGDAQQPGFIQNLQSAANNPEVVAMAQQAKQAASQPKIYQKDSDFEVFESAPESTGPVVINTAPKKLRPNDKVSVRYPDGRILKDVKYKKVEEEVEKGLCQII